MAALSTIALAGIAATSAASTATTYAAQRKQGRIARSEGDFAGMMYDRNAGYAEEQATDAIARGAEQAHHVERGTKRLGGVQRAALAAQGVEVSADDALAIQQETGMLGALDAATVRHNARREALGFTRDAETYRMQGRFARQAGANRAGAYRMQSYGTLLTGASDLAGFASDRGMFDRGMFDRTASPRLVDRTARGIRRAGFGK